MFTGIVRAVGTVTAYQRRGFGVRLAVGYDAQASPLAGTGVGESVAVGGVCLTVVESAAGALAFDVVPQTLGATTLGDKVVGSRVNLEPSLAAGQPMSGHFVQGHVDGIAIVTRLERGEAGHRVTFEVDRALLPYVVPRGSITLDGVSMTLAEVDAGKGTFTVAVIPTTLGATTLGELAEGDRVNVETDILARTIVHRLHLQAQTPETVDLSLLRAAGFVA